MDSKVRSCMVNTLPAITLKSGERVGAAIVRAPDPAWAERVETMLRHKGDPWNWQNSELLRSPVGLAARFFLLHRAGVPFANIMLVETNGIAILGHVWTEPADRGAGASSMRMNWLLEDFQARGGRALFLGTDFDSDAWRYYQRRGFVPVEPGSGYMARYFQPPAEFDRACFDARESILAPLDWPDWPAAAPLFLGDFPGQVRIAATKLVGRCLPEGPLLPILREQRRRRTAGDPACACVLRAQPGGAVLGFASRQPDPLVPDGIIVDLFCHPHGWRRAGEMLAALGPFPSGRTVAYTDAGLAPKRAVLEAAGFLPTTISPREWAPPPHGRPVDDVVVYVKR